MQDPDLQTLYDKKHELILEENFKEARKTELKIQEVQEKKRKHSLVCVQSKLKEEDAEMNLSFERCASELKTHWETLLHNERNKAKSFIHENTEKNHNFIEAQRAKLAKFYTFKPSSKLLSVIKSKENAVKAGDLEAAQRFKVIEEKLCKKETETFEAHKKDCIDKKHEAYTSKFKRDYSIIKDKQRSHFRILKRQKEVELDNLNKRFNYIRRRREASQSSSFKEYISKRGRTSQDKPLDFSI